MLLIFKWESVLGITFCERMLHYLAYKHGHIRCPINVNNNILPTVTVDLVIDNGRGVMNDTVV